MLQNWKDTNIILQQIYVNPAAGVNATPPQANLHIGAGIAAVNGAPMMIDAGTLLTTPVSGAIETNGIHFYWTDNTNTRRQLDQQASSPSVPFTLTGANAAAFSIGPNGATNPTFQVDTSEASAATGILVEGFSAGSGANIEVQSSGTNESLDIEAKGTGLINLNTTIGTGAVKVGSLLTVNSNNAAALAVGPNGATNPSFNVDASTASAVTGINIKSAAAAAGVAISVLSTGSNENLTLDAKGSGTITLASVSTGKVSVNSLLNVTSTSANALTAGANGIINPAFNVDASTASSATGLNIKSAAAAGGLAVSVLSSGTNENLTINAKGSGTISLGSVSTGNVLTSVPVVITSTSATSIAVGANGTTNPVFSVDASVGSVATGVNIQGQAAGFAPVIGTISSGTNEGLQIQAKGTGIVTFASNITVFKNGAQAFSVGANGQTNPAFNVDASTASSATGFNVKSAAAGAGVALSVISSGSNESMTLNAKGTGTITVQSAIAVPAGGSAAASLLMSSTASLGIYFGSGAPTVSAAQGSVYIRTDGSSTSTRLYINTNGSTTWTNVTTAA